MKTRFILTALMMIVMCGCGKKQTKEWEPRDLGDYVYVDQYNVVHTSRSCYVFYSHASEETTKERKTYEDGVIFVPSLELPHWMRETVRFCPHCVNDRQSDQIREIYKGYKQQVIRTPITEPLRLGVPSYDD